MNFIKMPMEKLYSLFEGRFGVLPESVMPLTGSASSRNYYRLSASDKTCIGVIGTDPTENRAFVRLAVHFAAKGISVPEVYAISDDGMAYIQSDLGDETLFSLLVKARKNGHGMEKVNDLLLKTIALLPKIQFEVASDLDFGICHPQKEFDRRSVMFDLEYFKYCFLKPLGMEFHELFLQDDFERLADDLLDVSLAGLDKMPTFLYRDFQARNVMVKDDEVYFIDFQSGRKGPVFYDLSSFVWQARAGYDKALQDRMLDVYLESLSTYVSVDRAGFMSVLRKYRLLRYLQVLGAYGFRGWIEHKANFVVSIPSVLQALRELVAEPFERYPYLMSILKDMLNHPRLNRELPQDGTLEVKVSSFSFLKGIPEDATGNGGGYVFDCRSIHNPGRYEPYKKLTGRDEPVIRFLEEDGEITRFLEHVYRLVEPHVETYRNRGFTSLMVSFGCTGGQHRSVYCAEHLARHLADKYPDIRVRLIHREQNVEEML